MTFQKHGKNLIFSILCICFISRIAIFGYIVFMNPDGFFVSKMDSVLFWKISDNVLNHGTFSRSDSAPYKPEHSRPPIYPFFLSILKFLGFNAPAIVFTQILLSTLTCYFVILTILELQINRNIAFITGFLFSIDIPTIVFVNALYSETLFTFLFVLTLYYFTKSEKNPYNNYLLPVSGFILGLAILCRPIATYFPVFILLILILKNRINKRCLVKILIFLIPCVLCLTPWLIRNKIVFGKTFLTTNGQYNLLYINAASVIAKKNGTDIKTAQISLREKTRKEFPGDPDKEPIELRKYEGKLGISIILENFVIYCKNHFKSLIGSCLKPVRSSIDLQLGLTEKPSSLESTTGKYDSSIISRLLKNTSFFTIIVVFIQLVTIAPLWFLFFWGVFFLLKEKRFFELMLITLPIIYFCIVTLSGPSYSRFRIPFTPLWLTGASVGLISFYGVLKRKFVRN